MEITTKHYRIKIEKLNNSGPEIKQCKKYNVLNKETYKREIVEVDQLTKMIIDAYNKYNTN